MKVMTRKLRDGSKPGALRLFSLMAALFTVLWVYSLPVAHAATSADQGHVRWVPQSFSELAQKYSPAVVNIRSEKKRETPS